jgi:hypothetical protein
VFFLIVFIVYGLVMVGVTGFAWQRGDASRLTHGMDSAGNLCGMPGQPRVPSDAALRPTAMSVHGATWGKRKLIWFPAAPKLNVPNSLKLGICVDHCPKLGDVVQAYVEGAGPWSVLYDSVPVLGRCVPLLKDKDRVQGLTDLRASVKATAWVLWFVQNAWAFRWAVGVVTLTAVGFCFAWTTLMTVAMRPIIHLTLALLTGVLGTTAYLLWTQSETALVGMQAFWAKVGAGVVVVLLAAYVILLTLVGSRIQIAAEIIEMSAQVLLRAPRLLTVPLASFGWWLLLTVWWVYVSALLNTAGQIHDGDVQFPKGSHIHVTYADSSGSLGQMAWATLFGYLWTSSFLAAFAYMSIAFVSVAWYFSAPGAAKSVPEGAVGRSIEITWRYHLGTLAIGSLLLSMVQALRLFFRVVEQQCRKLRDSNRLWQSVVNCIHCCLGCMERGVQLVDQTAYVVTCIEGTGFCASAGTGVQLVYHNVARVGTAAVVVDAVLYLVKFSITGVNALLAWGLMTRVDYFKVDDGAKLPGLILVAIITYMTSCFFVGVFHTVVDAVLLCFLVDERDNNGKERPFYMPPALQELTARRNLLTDTKGVP